MRRQEISINPKSKILKVNTSEIPNSCVIIISDGKAKIRELPDYGDYRIVTHQGKVKRMKREEGEDY